MRGHIEDVLGANVVSRFRTILHIVQFGLPYQPYLIHVPIMQQKPRKSLYYTGLEIVLLQCFKKNLGWISLVYLTDYRRLDWGAIATRAGMVRPT